MIDFLQKKGGYSTSGLTINEQNELQELRKEIKKYRDLEKAILEAENEENEENENEENENEENENEEKEENENEEKEENENEEKEENENEENNNNNNETTENKNEEQTKDEKETVEFNEFFDNIRHKIKEAQNDDEILAEIDAGTPVNIRELEHDMQISKEHISNDLIQKLLKDANPNGRNYIIYKDFVKLMLNK